MSKSQQLQTQCKPNVDRLQNRQMQTAKKDTMLTQCRSFAKLPITSCYSKPNINPMQIVCRVAKYQMLNETRKINLCLVLKLIKKRQTSCISNGSVVLEGVMQIRSSRLVQVYSSRRSKYVKL